MAYPMQRAALEECTAIPAPPTLLHVPRQMESRVAAILVRVLHAVVRAHAEVGPDGQETQDAWELIWAAPSLLLRIPPGTHLPAADGADAGPAGPSVAQILRQRCQRAESWDWESLMLTMLEERGAAGRLVPSDDLRDVRADEARRFATVTELVQADAV